MDLLSHPRLFETLTFDHFHPRGRGGSDDAHNRVVSCAACDKWKRSYCPTSMQDARELLTMIRSRVLPHFERYRVAFRPFDLSVVDAEGGAV